MWKNYQRSVLQKFDSTQLQSTREKLNTETEIDIPAINVNILDIDNSAEEAHMKGLSRNSPFKSFFGAFLRDSSCDKIRCTT